MEIITSVHNQTVCSAKKLLDKKYRQREGKFLAEGITAVSDMAKLSPLDTLFVSESAYVAGGAKLSALLSGAYPVYVLAEKVFAMLAETVTPSGVIGVFRIPTYDDLEGTSRRILVLDGVSDAGNMGTLIRSALAFGFRDIFAVDCVDAYSGKVVRSTMSALLGVRLRMVSHAELFTALRRVEGIRVCALDMHGTAIDSISTADGVAVIVGNESRGLSQAVLDEGYPLVSIPMSGELESLNAAVAGSIAMYCLR